MLALCFYQAFGTGGEPLRYALSLLGRVNHVLSADPQSAEFLRYRTRLTGMIAQLPPESPCADKERENGGSPQRGPDCVRVPCFGDIDISRCPSRLNLDGMEGPFPDKAALSRFVADNFHTFRRSGKEFAVCRGENSLAAVILIAEGILHKEFFALAKYLLCENGELRHKIGTATLGPDVRKGFPVFYTSLLDLFGERKLLYTNIRPEDDPPAAIVIPNCDKLISGWLPRKNRREILQKGIGLPAGEKNGMVLERLYGTELTDERGTSSAGSAITKTGYLP